MKLRHGTAAVAGMLAFLTLPMTAQAYSALYVFGDSLSDAGNVYSLTVGADPAAPYVNGQYTNGPTWVEDLSAYYGLGAVTPSLSGRNDYAYGGSTTGAAVPGPIDPVPSLVDQVNTFTTAVNGKAPSTALYAVWSGANDLFAILSNGLGSTTTPMTSTQAAAAAEGAAATEAGAIGMLAKDGARNFVVPLVPDLGLTPTATAAGAATETAATQLSAIFNSALEDAIQTLVAGTGISVSLVDTYSLIDAAVADPSAFGFTNATGSCYTGPETGGVQACSDPNDYLFWDEMHPTAAGHALVAASAEAALPEPGTLALLAFGLTGLAGLRVHRSALLRMGHAEEKPKA